MGDDRLLRNVSWEELLMRIDADLVRAESAAAPARDERAWGELHARVIHYAKTLLRKPFRWGRPRAWEPEDLAQELCAKLHSRKVLARFRAARKPGGYLVTTLRNLEADHLRQTKEVPRTETSPKRLEGVRNKGGVRRPQALPDMALALQRALAQLSLEDRALYHERFVLGRSLRDIATDLGITYSAAGVRVHRLKKRLRDHRGLSDSTG